MEIRNKSPTLLENDLLQANSHVPRDSRYLTSPLALEKTYNSKDARKYPKRSHTKSFTVLNEGIAEEIRVKSPKLHGNEAFHCSSHALRDTTSFTPLPSVDNPLHREGARKLSKGSSKKLPTHPLSILIDQEVDNLGTSSSKKLYHANLINDQVHSKKQKPNDLSFNPMLKDGARLTIGSIENQDSNQMGVALGSYQNAHKRERVATCRSFPTTTYHGNLELETPLKRALFRPSSSKPLLGSTAICTNPVHLPTH
ncbi:hypothetical protein O6P43_013866 [Quillaja saponaria]|uniref:Uncharacterized protein n=1 Tax=Quillaja saponaria TaxID=32244 RepID=A0AAD7PRB0_QUISA|nr:hypothetical protein O6P43_013866 [Quillaja saponaria]